jgi:hypothetical protein
MVNNDKAPENSLFVRRIREAILAHEPFTGILHVSVSDEMKWEETKSGYKVLVRWACWNLELDDQNVTEPEFEVLGESITRERLTAELPNLFPTVTVVVDGDIEM